MPCVPSHGSSCACACVGWNFLFRPCVCCSRAYSRRIAPSGIIRYANDGDVSSCAPECSEAAATTQMPGDNTWCRAPLSSTARPLPSPQQQYPPIVGSQTAIAAARTPHRTQPQRHMTPAWLRVPSASRLETQKAASQTPHDSAALQPQLRWQPPKPKRHVTPAWLRAPANFELSAQATVQTHGIVDNNMKTPGLNPVAQGADAGGGIRLPPPVLHPPTASPSGLVSRFADDTARATAMAMHNVASSSRRVLEAIGRSYHHLRYER